MRLLERLRTAFKGAAPRAIQPVTEASVAARLDLLEPDLARELREVVAALRSRDDVAYLVFEVRAVFAFERFPVCAFTFDVAGRDLTSAAHGRELLPGRVLLDPTGAYPLGVQDLAGIDTTSDLALVERVLIARFHRAWASVAAGLERPRAYVGVPSDAADGTPAPSPMLNLASGNVESVGPFGG